MGLTGFNLRRRKLNAKLKSVETKEPIEKSAQVVETEKSVVKENLTTEQNITEKVGEKKSSTNKSKK